MFFWHFLTRMNVQSEAGRYGSSLAAHPRIYQINYRQKDIERVFSLSYHLGPPPKRARRRQASLR